MGGEGAAGLDWKNASSASIQPAIYAVKTKRRKNIGRSRVMWKKPSPADDVRVTENSTRKAIVAAMTNTNRHPRSALCSVLGIEREFTGVTRVDSRTYPAYRHLGFASRRPEILRSRRLNRPADDRISSTLSIAAEADRACAVSGSNRLLPVHAITLRSCWRRVQVLVSPL